MRGRGEKRKNLEVLHHEIAFGRREKAMSREEKKWQRRTFRGATLTP